MYKYHAEKVTRRVAQSTCRSEGMTLAVPLTSRSNSIIRTIIPSSGVYKIHIGVNDKGSEGSWVSDYGGRLTWTNWRSGEPNDADGGEDCGFMYQSDGRWNDDQCSRKEPFVCQFKPRNGMYTIVFLVAG